MKYKFEKKLKKYNIKNIILIHSNINNDGQLTQHLYIWIFKLNNINIMIDTLNSKAINYSLTICTLNIE